jgi:hypothetical protein
MSAQGVLRHVKNIVCVGSFRKQLIRQLKPRAVYVGVRLLTLGGRRRHRITMIVVGRKNLAAVARSIEADADLTIAKRGTASRSAVCIVFQLKSGAGDSPCSTMASNPILSRDGRYRETSRAIAMRHRRRYVRVPVEIFSQSVVTLWSLPEGALRRDREKP